MSVSLYGEDDRQNFVANINNNIKSEFVFRIDVQNEGKTYQTVTRRREQIPGSESVQRRDEIPIGQKIKEEKKYVRDYINNKESCQRFPRESKTATWIDSQTNPGKFYDNTAKEFRACQLQKNRIDDALGNQKTFLFDENKRTTDQKEQSLEWEVIPEDVTIKASYDTRNNYFYHQIFVGLFGLNQLRKKIPTFAYVYGGFECSGANLNYPSLSNKHCSAGNNQIVHCIQEKILDNDNRKSKTLRQFLSESGSVEDFGCIYLQVLLALDYANKEIGFTHYDLDDSNVLVKKISKEHQLRFPYEDRKTGDETKVFVFSDKVAVIKDYLFSRIEYNDVSYGFPGLEKSDLEKYGLSDEESFILNDAFKLLVTSIKTVLEQINGYKDFVDRAAQIKTMNELYKFFYDNNYFDVISEIDSDSDFKIDEMSTPKQPTYYYFDLKSVLQINPITGQRDDFVLLLFYENQFESYKQEILKQMDNLYYLPPGEPYRSADLTDFIDHFLIVTRSENQKYFSLSDPFDSKIKLFYCSGKNCSTVFSSEYDQEPQSSLSGLDYKNLDYYEFNRITEDIGFIPDLIKRKTIKQQFSKMVDRKTIKQNTADKINENIRSAQNQLQIYVQKDNLIAQINEKRFINQEESQRKIKKEVYENIKQLVDILTVYGNYVADARQYFLNVPLNEQNDPLFDLYKNQSYKLVSFYVQNREYLKNFIRDKILSGSSYETQWYRQIDINKLSERRF